MTDPIALIRAALEEAAYMAREGFMIVAPEGIGQRAALESYRAQISDNIVRAIDPHALLRRVQEGQHEQG